MALYQLEKLPQAYIYSCAATKHPRAATPVLCFPHAPLAQHTYCVCRQSTKNTSPKKRFKKEFQCRQNCNASCIIGRLHFVSGLVCEDEAANVVGRVLSLRRLGMADKRVGKVALKNRETPLRTRNTLIGAVSRGAEWNFKARFVPQLRLWSHTGTVRADGCTVMRLIIARAVANEGSKLRAGWI